jgi:hypothetical protein
LFLFFVTIIDISFIPGWPGVNMHKTETANRRERREERRERREERGEKRERERIRYLIHTSVLSATEEMFLHCFSVC